MKFLIKFTALALVFCNASHAQTGDSWPNKPITMVVASAAGSGLDVTAREMASKLSAVLNQPIIVDNKPGASGMIAGAAVARAKPDGYTILYSNGSFIAVTPALIQKMSYDPAKDLTPIAQTAVGGIILSVNKDVPANNLKELVDLIKANPDKYSYGTWGAGSSGHLTTEWLKRKADLKINHVQYKSTPQIVNDLVSGALSIGWSDPATPVPMLEAKRIKGIAISGNTRVARTPQIATMADQGYAFDAVGWFGVFGPAGLPAQITNRLNSEINQIIQSAEMKKKMESMNFEPPPNKTAEEFKRIIARDLVTWKAIATDIQLKLD